MTWRRFLKIEAIILAVMLACGAIIYGLHRFGYLSGVTDWIQDKLNDWRIGIGQPWFLLLLGLIPLLIPCGFLLATLGPVRRWLVVGLRCAIVLFLVLALAEVQGVQEDETLTLVVLADRSYSIPQELSGDAGDGTSSTLVLRDQRWKRIAEALKQATKNREKKNDRVGVVTFARRPRLEFPASDVQELNIQGLSTISDQDYTDIAGAIRLGLASFPEGSARRLLLISDGNENRGDVLKEARNAKLNGVPIDVVPLKYTYQNEVVVDRIDAPSETQENRDLTIRVVVRNYSKNRVPGTLSLWRQAGDKQDPARLRVTLDPGLNVLPLKWQARGPSATGAYTYRAVFQPDGLPSDRSDNNEAWAPVIVRGEGRRVLIVTAEPNGPDHQALERALQNEAGKATKKGLQVDVWSPERVPGEKDARFYELSNYDCIILYNIPADMMPAAKQEALRKNTRDQGCGLVVVGGKDSFGAGRWQGEPLEEALPVNTDIQSLKVQGKGGLVLIMHASEMSQGNYWQTEIAKLAVNKLSPVDEVGVIYYEHSPQGHKWHVPLQPIGQNKRGILQLVQSMFPGDMPDFDPAVKMAHDSLTEAKRGLGTKHIILISDGDHGLLQDFSLLDKLKKSKVTLTTVGVTTHGPAAQAALKRISKDSKLGEHYPVENPEQLPSIYIKETRMISQNHLYEKAFSPLIVERGDPLREWSKNLPPLHGYVRTTLKESNLVQMLLRSPAPTDDINPLLAQWQYGLGRVVAFTSDAGGQATSWARDWAKDEGGMYTEFWSKVVEWALRTVDDAGLSLQTRYENGKIRVALVDNRDRAKRSEKPLANMKLIVTSSGVKDAKEVPLEPTSAGVYEGLVDAEASGAYSVAVSGIVSEAKADGKPDDQPRVLARGALAVPYSPEFATVKSNEGMMEQIARETGGQVIQESELAQADLFKHTFDPTRTPQPIWHWLLFIASGLLFLDIAARRITVDPVAIAARVGEAFSRLRGQSKLSEQSQEYFDKLKSRKSAVGEEIVKPKGTERFDAAPTSRPLQEVSATEPRAVSRPEPPKPKPAPKPEASKDDFATRLMKAKQKAREQIEGDQKDQSN